MSIHALRRAAFTMLLLMAVGPFLPIAAQGETIDLWAALRDGGKIVLIRHALAPGTGDPPAFDLADCATQRNLSAAGRRQAAAIGAAFRANQVPIARVLSSAWCRCRETARLAFGENTVWSPLNSFFRHHDAAPPRLRAMRDRIATWQGPGTLVMVTHQVNVTGVTDVYPGSGEAVILAPGDPSSNPEKISVLGRLSFDQTR